jgi:DNA-binding MarR family transcriptional regulator
MKEGITMYDDILLLDKQICFRLYRASKNMTRLYQPYLSKFNLTYPQYIVMLAMFEHKVLDFKDLSKIVDLKTATLTPIIQKLEEIGYLIKNKNEKDRRKVNVKLTKKGRELKEVILEVPLKVSEKLPISEEQYKTLVSELDSLTTLIKEKAKPKSNAKE